MSSNISHICDCCREVEGTIVDTDLDAHVCIECHRRLRGAAAWLKQATGGKVLGCTKANDKRGEDQKR